VTSKARTGLFLDLADQTLQICGLGDVEERWVVDGCATLFQDSHPASCVGGCRSQHFQELGLALILEDERFGGEAVGGGVTGGDVFAGGGFGAGGFLGVGLDFFLLLFCSYLNLE